MRPGDWEVANAAWEAEWAFLMAAYGIDHLRRKSRAVAELIWWWIRTFRLTGPAEAIPRIKEMTGYARSVALGVRDRKRLPDLLRKLLLVRRKGHVPGRILEQFSYVGRALPQGRGKVIEEALRGHLDNLTTVQGVCPPNLHEWAKSFATRTAIKWCHPTFWAGTAATVSRGRKEGGLLADYFELSTREREIRECPRTGLTTVNGSDGEPVPVPKELVFRTSEALRKDGTVNTDYQGEEDMLNNAGSWDLLLAKRAVTLEAVKDIVQAAQEARLPVIQRVVVPEYGWKARIVTKSPGSLQIAGQAIRRQIYGVLKRLPYLAPVLEGKPTEGIKRIFEKPLPGTGAVLSTDLKNATDTVNQEAILTMWDGLSEGWGFSDQLRLIGKVILGPHVIIGEDGGTLAKPESVSDPGNFVTREEAEASGNTVTSNGILMGNPLTWAMLNLIHLFAVEEAWKGVIRRGELPPEWEKPLGSIPKLHRTFSLCGDDLVAFWPPALIRAYDQEMRRLGFITSPTKHYVSPFGGVFTEVIFHVGRVRSTTPYHVQIQEREKRVTRVNLANYSYAIASRAVPDPNSPYSHRIIRVPVTTRTRHLLADRVTLSKSIPLRGLLDTTSEQPRWSSVGESTRALLDRVDRSRIASILNHRFRKVIRFLRTKGILPEAPQRLGGPGFWFCPPTSPTKCRGHRRAIAAHVYASDKVIDDARLGRIWSPISRLPWMAMSIQQAQNDLYADSTFVMRRVKNAFVPKGARIVDEFSMDEDCREEGLLPPGELVTELALEYAQAFYLMMGPEKPGALPRLSLATVVRELRREFTDLIAEWPSAKPVRDLDKAATDLAERADRLRALPAVASYVPKTPAEEAAPAGWRTKAARRATFHALGWGPFLHRPLGPA